MTPTPEELRERVARAIYDSMDLMDKLDVTAAQTYADAALRIALEAAAGVVASEAGRRIRALMGPDGAGSVSIITTTAALPQPDGAPGGTGRALMGDR